jgi:threonine/homoserine/homoserine lactone efflux protein
MTLEFTLLYAFTVFVASITPGPSMMLALDHGIRYGAKRTMVTAAGNVTATMVQAGLSITGLSAILLNSEPVFNAIRYLGALYLIYIGIRTFFSPPALDHADATQKGPSADVRPGRLFVEALCVTAGNPKAILFFTALFPQFIGRRGQTVAEIVAALSILAAIAFLCFMIYAVFGERLVRLFRGSPVKNLFNRLVGMTLVGMGITLAAGRRG